MTSLRTSSTDRAVTRWVDDLVIALRAREVPGDRIGELVAEVEEHLAESGQTPEEAFGSPADYAAQRAPEVPGVTPTPVSGWVSSLAPTFAGVAGLILLLPALGGLKHGRSVTVSWGQLASFVVLALVAAALVRWLDRLATRRVSAVLAFALVPTTMMLLPILWRAPAFALPATVAVVLAVLLLAVSVIGQLTWAKVDADPVADPFSGRDRYDDGSVGSRVVDLTMALQAWGIALAAAVLGAVTWFAG